MTQPLPPPPPEPKLEKKRSHWLSNVLLLAGFAFLVYGGWIVAESRLAQAWASYEFKNSAPEQPVEGVPVIPPPEKGEWIGRLEIPRLNVSAMVREGDDDATLRIAVGHLPGTPLPGQPGRVALAGHRDTFFRALRDVRNQDVIRLETQYGTQEYVVEQIKIVRPTQTEVLRSDGKATLSLITCYPFNYVGSAPERLVVLARETKETTVDVAGRSRTASSAVAGRKKAERR